MRYVVLMIRGAGQDVGSEEASEWSLRKEKNDLGEKK